jgi:hypothetical protein
MMMPKQLVGLQQVNAWGAENIQEYCAGLWPAVEPLLNKGGIELPKERHLRQPNQESLIENRESRIKRVSKRSAANGTCGSASQLPTPYSPKVRPCSRAIIPLMMNW